MKMSSSKVCHFCLHYTHHTLLQSVCFTFCGAPFIVHFLPQNNSAISVNNFYDLSHIHYNRQANATAILTPASIFNRKFFTYQQRIPIVYITSSAIILSSSRSDKIYLITERNTNKCPQSEFV